MASLGISKVDCKFVSWSKNRCLFMSFSPHKFTFIERLKTTWSNIYTVNG